MKKWALSLPSSWIAASSSCLQLGPSMPIAITLAAIRICNQTCNLSLWMPRVHRKLVRISELTLPGLLNPVTHRFCAHTHPYHYFGVQAPFNTFRKKLGICPTFFKTSEPWNSENSSIYYQNHVLTLVKSVRDWGLETAEVQVFGCVHHTFQTAAIA